MLQLVEDNVRCLQQGLDLMQGLPAGEFAWRHPECFGSTIGGHMRHNIDHYESFLRGLPEGGVDYDERRRDPAVEADPAKAAQCVRKHITALEALSEQALDTPLEVKMDSGGDPALCSPTRSSGWRELQFLLSHTVHHYALIVVLCQLRGISTALDFGVAPSTLRHRGQGSCAQ